MNEEVIKNFLNFFRKVNKTGDFFAKLEANKIKPEGKEAYSDETKRDFKIITNN